MTREELKDMMPVVQTYVDDEKREVINEELDDGLFQEVKWSDEEPTKVKLIINK